MSLSKLGYKFKDSHLEALALTHKSFFYENHRPKTEYFLGGHNEKLEFVGDAVLDLVLSDLLLMKFPTDGEGALSKKRASLVNEDLLMEIALELELNVHMLLGKGEASTGGAQKSRLLASAYEALVGAVFLDSGYDDARKIIAQHFSERIDSIDPEIDFVKDYKTRLQEIIQKGLKETPTYELISEEGPSHEKKFWVAVKVAGKVVAQAPGKSKKQAEQEAARLAIEKINQG